MRQRAVESHLEMAGPEEEKALAMSFAKLNEQLEKKIFQISRGNQERGRGRAKVLEVSC